jgi:hypothetical protein
MVSMSAKPLRILQVNLNKSAPATEGALQVAVELDIDLLVVQEPWLTPSQQSPPDFCQIKRVLMTMMMKTMGLNFLFLLSRLCVCLCT